MGITIKELAKISGYSTATISRVITNKGNVRPETREAIEKLLEEQNYRTSIMDLRITKAKTSTVMIITGDLDNWYYMEMIRRLTGLLDQNGYSALIAYTDNDPDREEAFLETAVREQYSGVIFINVRGDDKIREILKNSRLPSVFLNRGIKRAYFNTVCNDNYIGSYNVVSLLIQLGHRKIGHMMGNSYSVTALDRRRGYTEAMENHGLPVTGSSIFQGRYDWKSGFEYAEYIVKKGMDFTAVFIGSYQMTEGFLDGMKLYGVSIPEDISVACFDETPSMERAGITTVCSDPMKMARGAVELLQKSIEDPLAETKRVYQEPVIIRRNSIAQLIN